MYNEGEAEIVSLTEIKPLVFLRGAIDAYAQHQAPSGELCDPFFQIPTQYSTPYFAYCCAVLASTQYGGARQRYLDMSLRGLDASLRHVSDPGGEPAASSFDRATGAAGRSNHRDFFWPPILKTYLLHRQLDAGGTERYASRIQSVGIQASFRSRPPSNWAAVWLSGEWLRIREGLSSVPISKLDTWLGEFFQGHIISDLGMFQEPGHPNSYDLFTRYHLADILVNGYNGALRPQLEGLMTSGLRRSLDVQLSDGSLASAHRSTGQTWTLGAQCAYFTHAAAFIASLDPQLSAQVREAAARAYISMVRWQRPDELYSPVENCLPAAYRVGYESYTADGHYANLALAFLASAIQAGFSGVAIPEALVREPRVLIEHDPVWRAIAHCGNYSVHVNAFPSPKYDGFGIVDLTVGPGRYLQFASTVKHVESGEFFNLGLSHRPSAGLSDLWVAAQRDFVLVGGITRRRPSGFVLEARERGVWYPYRLEVNVSPDGAHIAESTPQLVNHKTLLVPYLRDTGRDTQTVTRTERGRIVLEHGDEEVAIGFGMPIERVLDLPYGYENRRGLCGLLRVDFEGEREGIEYTVRATR